MSTIMKVLRSIYCHAPLRWYRRKAITRFEIIQRCVNALDARTYLEIGVADGDCFSRIQVPRKIGVDPIAAAPLVKATVATTTAEYHELTSDAFFQTMAPQVMRDGVDVVFIDGLHTQQQAYRDCMNALKYLAPKGLILLHDCLPANDDEGRPAATIEEAKRLNGPSWKGCWTGDVWKAIVTIRARHPDLKACVLHTDHGVGLVEVGKASEGLSITESEIASMTYTDLLARPRTLLGLRAPAYLLRTLAQR